MKQNLRYALVMLLSIIFINCSSNEDNELKTDEAAKISATINGKAWVATKVTSVTLTRLSTTGEQRFDINAEDENQRLFLACSSELTTSIGMPLRTYGFDIENDSPTALFLNYYLIGENSYSEHFTQLGKLTITSVNEAKKTISGTFSYSAEKIGVLQEQIVTPESLEVTNGVFTNLTYTVVSY